MTITDHRVGYELSPFSSVACHQCRCSQIFTTPLQDCHRSTCMKVLQVGGHCRPSQTSSQQPIITVYFQQTVISAYCRWQTCPNSCSFVSWIMFYCLRPFPVDVLFLCLHLFRNLAISLRYKSITTPRNKLQTFPCPIYMDLPEGPMRALYASVWNQSFPSPGYSNCWCAVSYSVSISTSLGSPSIRHPEDAPIRRCTPKYKQGQTELA